MKFQGRKRERNRKNYDIQKSYRYIQRKKKRKTEKLKINNEIPKREREKSYDIQKSYRCIDWKKRDRKN